MSSFYAADQARIHHERFGDLARDAAASLVARLRAAGHDRGTVVDLGAGSGILARIVGDAGYHVLGIDLSPEMIDLARKEAPAATFRCESLLDADIPPAVGVTAIGEPFNYMTDERAGLGALAPLFERVRNALAPGGAFLFDVTMPGRYGPTGEVERFHDHETWSLGMHGSESDDGSSLERRIAIFVREADGRYRRVDEHHVLRLYRPREIVEALENAGFDVETLSAYGAEPSRSTPATGWAVFVACPR